MPILNFPRADCHCHTCFSDGTLSPLALLDLAKERALTGLSITDHDTLAAYESAIPYAQQLEIELIPGIEISAECQNASVHILGYAFNLRHTGLLNLCATIGQSREQRNRSIVDKLIKHNMPLSWEEIQTQFPNRTLGRPHIANMMVQKGYVKTTQQAFARFLGDNRVCYVKGTFPTVEETITILHQAGGFAVIAHPHYLTPKRLITTLRDLPFDGIEAYYGRLTPAQERPWIKLAQQKNWFTTGGSDFHGEAKAYATLGSSWTPDVVFQLFKERTLENNYS